MGNALNMGMFGAQLYTMKNMGQRQLPAMRSYPGLSPDEIADMGAGEGMRWNAANTATAGSYFPVAIASLAGSEVGENIAPRLLPFGGKRDKANIGAIGGGAAAGAAMGSIVPGVGTAIGAGVGALAGLAKRLFRL